MPDGGKFIVSRHLLRRIYHVVGGSTPLQYNIPPAPVNRQSVQAEGPSRPIGAVPTSWEVGHLFTRLLSAVPTSWEVGH